MSRNALVVGDGGRVCSAVVRTLEGRGDTVGLIVGGDVRAVQLPDGVTAAAADLTEDTSMAEAVAGARREVGQFASVVVVSGPSVGGQIDWLQPDDWARCIDRTLTTTYLVARHTMSDLVMARGAFVAVTSTAGVRGLQNNGAYAAAAHGVIGLVKSMALDHSRQGVRCNVVCTGHVEGSETFSVLESPDERLSARRAAQPHEIAHLVDQLTSERSSYSTGTVAVVD